MTLEKLFAKTIEKLKTTDDLEEIAEILEQFENELPKGKIKKFFTGLGGEIDDTSQLDDTDDENTTIEKLEKFLEQLKQVMVRLESAPEEIPQEIIDAHKKANEFFINEVEASLFILKITTGLKKFLG